MLVGSIVPAASQVRQNRIAITPQRVASAMADAGWKVRSDQVKLLSQVTTADGNGRLQVVQVTHWQDKLKAELRCNDPGACLPFYVLVDKDKTTEKAAENVTAGVRATPTQSEAEPGTEKPVMRSGDPATLKFIDKGLSITMPVICLESGRQGQKIRVTSADHRRFYKAEIVGPGLLKATTL